MASEKLRALEFNYIPFRIHHQYKMMANEFPTPCVQPQSIQAEGTFHMRCTLQLIKCSLLDAPCLWILPTKGPSPLKEHHLDPEAMEIQFTDMDKPYTPDVDDEYIIYPTSNNQHNPSYMVFTAHKQVDKKIHPVSMQLPSDLEVIRHIPEDPMLTLPPLTSRPPDFVPMAKISQERMEELNVNATGFLWPEEVKLFQHVMTLNEQGIAFEDVERGTLKESYFSPYIIPTIPHSPWEYRNIPIPPGIMPKVLEVLKLKIAAEVYEQS